MKTDDVKGNHKTMQNKGYDNMNQAINEKIFSNLLIKQYNSRLASIIISIIYQNNLSPFETRTPSMKDIMGFPNHKQECKCNSKTSKTPHNADEFIECSWNITRNNQ